MTATRITFLTLIACTLAYAPCSWAASQNDTAQALDRNWQLGVALGYGTRSNPLIEADDLTLIAVVDFAWYGDYLFFDNGDLGVTFVDNHRFTLNGILRVNTERLFFENADSLLVSFTNSGVGSGNGGRPTPGDGTDGTDGGGDGGGSSGGVTTETFEIPDRDYAIEAGLELLTDGHWGFLQASATQDISSKHDGYELGLTLGRSGYWQRFTWTTSAGISYRSHDLNNYYYGVLPAEATNAFPSYEAGAGVNYQLSGLLRYYLSKSLSLGLVLQYERLNSAIADSPFVTDDHVTTGYAGLKFTF